MPKNEEQIRQFAEAIHITEEELCNRIDEQAELNPMMGFRGDHLCVAYPEIVVMQAKAIILAAIEVQKELNLSIEPEIMVPFVIDVKEFKFVKAIIKHTCDEEIKKAAISMNYHIGTMIEIPRAAILADEIGAEAEFFSFGTNDLTQMTMGLSRDDASNVLPHYYKNNIFEDDPFQTVDVKGVGRMIQLASELGRSTNPALHLGVCGETAGDPKSIEF